jgi:hypothetical protein
MHTDLWFGNIFTVDHSQERDINGWIIINQGLTGYKLNATGEKLSPVTVCFSGVDLFFAKLMTLFILHRLRAVQCQEKGVNKERGNVRGQRKLKRAVEPRKIIHESRLSGRDSEHEVYRCSLSTHFTYT